MIKSRAVTSLPARILEMTLYVTLQNARGLKSFAVEILADLGTRVITEWLTYFSNFPEEKKSWTAAQNPPPTTSHDFLKKREEKPSGPGALSFPMENRAFLMTVLETGARRERKSSPRQGPLCTTLTSGSRVSIEVPRSCWLNLTHSFPTSSTKEVEMPFSH